MPATIHIHRDKTAWSDRARSYKLLVDGEEQGELRHGEAKAFDVAPGRHTVQMKIDWATSVPIDVEMPEGATEHFTCRGRNPFGALYWTTFGRKKYIVLERGDSTA